ncbi:MAG TPA: hypothetical protein VF139_17270 [Candidatus Polarisedimenticolaceae bacterium]
MSDVRREPSFLFARARATRNACVAALLAWSPAFAQTPPGTTIVNIATASVGAQRFASNAASTRVAPTFSLQAVRLQVGPSGTVLPGQRLTYTLAATNASNAPLTAVRLELPLDDDLRIASPAVGPQRAYDAATRSAWWVVDALAPGASVSFTVDAVVREDAPPETRVELVGRALAAEVAEPVLSNPVLSIVLPPLVAVEKRVDRATAIPGEAVGYTILARHTGTSPDLPEATLLDTLPEQLRYVPGSLRVDGAAVGEPAIDAAGHELRVPVGPLPPGGVRVVRLAARVAATARAGEALNRAQVLARTAGGFDTASNVASAAIAVVPGPFRQEAHLVGRVFVDDDDDGEPDPGEPGVPGVLVVAEDGRGAVTDITGQWHLEGVRAGTHVVRLDRSTLPETLLPVDGGADWGSDRGSRIVVARTASLAIADLPVGPPGSARCRVASGDAVLTLPAASLLDAQGGASRTVDVHLEQAAQYLLDTGGRSPDAIVVGCPGFERSAPGIRSRLRELVARRAGVAAPAPEPSAPSPSPEPAKDPLERVVRESPPVVAIVSPADGHRAGGSQLAVEVAYPVGSRPVLEVNGVEVPTSRIGATSTLPSRGLAASRYVGVSLVPGPNLLRFHADGAEGSVERTVHVPGPVAALRLSPPETRWLADGVTPGRVRVEAVDAGGMRVAESPVVTVEIDGARPLAPDADPGADGWQIALEQGAAALDLAPRTFPGRVDLRARRDELEAEILVEVLPAGGAWRLVGLAEARVAGDGGVEGEGGVPPGPDAEALGSDARLAVLARGPIGRDARLTVSLDTARRRDTTRLFGGFEPDRFFPVYGDSSIESRETERQGPLFVRVDAPSGFAQLGDFETGFERTELARYDRRLSGASGRGRFGRFEIEGFAAPTEQTVVRDLFAPDGTSGPYLLSQRPVIARSERIVIETRDRYREDVVLARRQLVVDLDYDLDPEAGTILFRGPVAPFDGDLNPIRVVVLYELDGASPSKLVAGGRVTFRPDDRLDAGVSLVHEDRLGGALDLWGLDLAWRPLPGTSVRAEVAGTDDAGSTATATRLEARGRTPNHLTWEVAWRDLPAGYANPTLLAAPEVGSRRLGGSLLWDPGRAWRVKAEAFSQQDLETDRSRSVAFVQTERRFDRMTLLGGLHAVDSEEGGTSSRATLAEAGIRGRLGRRLTAEISRREALGGETTEGYGPRTLAGLAYDLAEGRRLFLRHEAESGDGQTRDRTALGVETRIGANTKATARYEMQGGASGTALRSATGIETVLPLRPGLSLQLAASRVDTTRGDDASDFTTLAAGIERRAGDSLLSARWETSLQSLETRHVATVSGAFRAGPSWMVFARERLFASSPERGDRAARAEGLWGAAYRPFAGRWQALLRLDHITSGGTPTTAGAILGSPPPAATPPGLGTDPSRSSLGPDLQTIVAALGVRASSRQRLAGTVALRRVDAEPSIHVGSSLTTLLGLHYTAEVHPRWTLGASARHFAQRDTRTSSFGAGVEAGYLVVRNLWVLGGWNVLGFRDDGFSDLDRTDRGPFVALRFKFDERTIEALQDWRLDRPHGGVTARR